jgi:hypothetical protein
VGGVRRHQRAPTKTSSKGRGSLASRLSSMSVMYESASRSDADTAAMTGCERAAAVSVSWCGPVPPPLPPHVQAQSAKVLEALDLLTDKVEVLRFSAVSKRSTRMPLSLAAAVCEQARSCYGPRRRRPRPAHSPLCSSRASSAGCLRGQCSLEQQPPLFAPKALVSVAIVWMVWIGWRTRTKEMERVR